MAQRPEIIREDNETAESLGEISESLERLERLVHVVSWLVVDLIGLVTAAIIFLPLTLYEKADWFWAVVAAGAGATLTTAGARKAINRALDRSGRSP